ncbi:YbdD/YjiX family protein [Sphingomonas sp. S6]|uniref:YbdD/YjiX family protein n=1 Tax=Sphingomonas sp. S6 TaxID=3368600 RepID=UPI000F9DCBDD|nr:YbdD/YjiX family protein [uncultured Sphingomonas sp.]RTL17145.1 MAG: YbdD/YjiX family protein [Sphingomonadaceae bacterium]
MTVAWTIRTLRDALHLLVGMPSYEKYRAHMAEVHPDRPIMSESAFFRDRQQARYGGRNGGRCC